MEGGRAKEIRGSNGDERNERGGEFCYEKKMKEGK